MGIYNAEISAGSLMIPESRRISKLLLVSPTVEQWDHAIEVENILQKKPATARRQARLMRNRLETLDQDGWQLIAEGDTEVASQILLAASIRHSQLLSDFLRDVYMMDLKKLEKTLSHHQWDSFIAECEHRDAAVASWAPSTRDKLFQVVVRILAEAKYLDSTRRLGLTPPMLHPQTRNYLKKLGDRATLSVMEAH